MGWRIGKLKVNFRCFLPSSFREFLGWGFFEFFIGNLRIFFVPAFILFSKIAIAFFECK